MDVFQNDLFEIGINMDSVDLGGIRQLFQTMRECPDCGQYVDAIDELEDEVWARYFLRDVA